MPKPSQETIAILGVGVALAALTWSMNSTLRAEVQAGQLRLETRLLAVEKEQARTAGLLEGLGITGRAGPGAAVGAGG